MGLYTLFPEDAVALSLSGFLFSLPCFYFAVARPQYLSASRFVLLTYNLICLYWYSSKYSLYRTYSFLILSYNLRQKDVLILHVGFHRAVAVMAGILWAALVSRFWWPAEARRELTKSLSELSFLVTVPGPWSDLIPKLLSRYWVAVYSLGGIQFICT